MLAKDIFNITKGKKVSHVLNKREKSALRYIQIEDLRDDNNLKFTDETNLVEVNEDDIVIAWDGANAGTVGFGLRGIIGSTLARLSIKNNFRNDYNTKYLGYYLSSKFEYFQNTSTGATIPHVSKFSLENLEINIPDLETQNKIVAVLDKAKTLLVNREKTIVIYDELLRATFLEMFGNPMQRPNRWSLQRIEKNLININAGTSYGGEDKKVLEADELGVLKVSSVTKGIFDPKEYKAVKKNTIKKAIITPQKGDLLFSRANTLEFVGATCIVHENYNSLFLPDKIWKVDTDEQTLSKVYLHYVLRNMDVRKTFLSIATGSSGSMLNISMDKFKNIEIPLPPIELQKKFEEKYYTYINIRNNVLLAANYVKRLKDSLSDLAFKGELVFDSSVDLEVLLENDYDFFKQNSTIKSIRLLLDRLDKNELNENKFYDSTAYDKAKGFVFELLKEEKIKQVFDRTTKRVKLTLL